MTVALVLTAEPVAGLYGQLTSLGVRRVDTTDGDGSGSGLLTILSLIGLALQCFMSGLSAEMLTRIYHETQQKSVYTVKATFTASARPQGKEEAA